MPIHEGSDMSVNTEFWGLGLILCRTEHGRMGTIWLRGGGGRGVDLAEILHTIFLDFSPLFSPNLGGQLPPPPRPLPRTPMGRRYKPLTLYRKMAGSLT